MTDPTLPPQFATTAPHPRLVIAVDLDTELPDPLTTESGDRAYVVAWRDGAPVGARDICLRDAGCVPAEQLRNLVEAAPRNFSSAEHPVADELLPPISVIVSTMVARPDDLRALLACFEAVDYPEAEFILVDNRRSVPVDDALAGIIAPYPRVRTIRAVRPGVSSGRNAGIAVAQYETLVFTDDDVRVEPSWLRAFGSRYVRQPELSAITGLILPSELETPAQLWFERYYGGFAGERTFEPVTLKPTGRQKSILGNARVQVIDSTNTTRRTFAIYGIGAYGAGANMSFRATAIRGVGGFDIALGTGMSARGGEDLAVLVRLLASGHSIGFDPHAVVHHRHRRHYDELLHQLDGYGVGFTAMLWSLIRDDPRHLLKIGAQLPAATIGMVRAFASKLGRGRKSGAVSFDRPDCTTSDAEVPFPRALASTELRGYPRGPWAYERSRRASRNWSQHAAVPGSAASEGVTE